MSTPEYKREKYDSISFFAPKGTRNTYKQAAEDFGLPLTTMIKSAVDTFIAERSLQNLPVKPAPLKSRQAAESLSPEERRLVEEFRRLPVDVQEGFMRTFKAINESSKGGDDND